MIRARHMGQTIAGYVTLAAAVLCACLAQAEPAQKAPVIGAQFDANWPKAGALGLNVADLIDPTPETGRGGPLPGKSAKYILSLSALSGTALLCDALKARACSHVPFHKDIQATGEGAVITGYWRPSDKVTITLQLASSGVVRFSVDHEGTPATVPPTVTPPAPPTLVAARPATPAPARQTATPAAFASQQLTVVPLPAGVWLLGGAIGALGALRRKRARA